MRRVDFCGFIFHAIPIQRENPLLEARFVVKGTRSSAIAVVRPPTTPGVKSCHYSLFA